MTEILELKKEISEMKNGMSNQTVSANINNPWVIAVALLAIIGYVYFDQQETQDNRTASNTTLIQTMQSDQKEQTDALTVLVGTVSTLAKDVERNSSASEMNEKDIREGTKDRFTNADGADIREMIRDLKSEFQTKALTQKSETREMMGKIESQVDSLAKDMATIKGQMTK